ncbi:hypothetical protein HY025_00500 [Candidatus Daviesbacteria bacterium]|nr:hypothetical protein [Candidatus Daviesbacteria bacterium]
MVEIAKNLSSRLPKPILCRSLSPDVSTAIDALIAGGVFRSRTTAVATLAQEGLSLRLESSPELKEVVEVYRRFQLLSEKVTSQSLQTPDSVITN